MGDVAAPLAPDEIRVSDRARRVLVVATTVLLVAIVAGLVALWPGTLHHRVAGDAIEPDARDDAVVTAIERGPCEDDANATCTTARVRLREGPHRGEIVALPPVTDAAVRLDAGEHIVVARYEGAGDGLAYAYSDGERRPPLLVLGLVAALLAVVLGRARGLGALAGAVAGIAVVVVFVLPAILDGASPLAVAVTGGGAIVVLAIYLRRGISMGSTVAVVGALAGVALGGALAWLAVARTHLSGRTLTTADALPLGASNVQLRGLLVAGLVIGSLRVLTDIAVRQVGAGWGVRGDEATARRAGVGRAMRAGREHVAASISALVLAYAGAALPVLLVLTQVRQSTSDAVNRELVAVEIVRALAGVAGLAAAVPITTLLATWA